MFCDGPTKLSTARKLKAATASNAPLRSAGVSPAVA
jgi:hypothetical protein